MLFLFCEMLYCYCNFYLQQEFRFCLAWANLVSARSGICRASTAFASASF